MPTHATQKGRKPN